MFRHGNPAGAAAVAGALVLCASAAPGRAAGGRTVPSARPAGLTLSVVARAIKPGELLVVNVATGGAAREIHVTAFGRSFTPYSVAPGRLQALVGIDLDTPPGPYTIAADSRTDDETITTSKEIVVRPGQFRTRTLRVAPEFVNPPAELEARIEQENALLQTVFSHPAAERLWTLPFVRPVPQAANSAFGTRSVFNGEARNPHAGTDFLSPAGTRISAPNAGHIVVARDLFFSGNTVVIDHGLGLFSMLAHLSRVDVREGDDVARRQLIGLVGATGRVTGPHLHWAVRVGDARVNALSLLALLGGNPTRP